MLEIMPIHTTILDDGSRINTMNRDRNRTHSNLFTRFGEYAYVPADSPRRIRFALYDEMYTLEFSHVQNLHSKPEKLQRKIQHQEIQLFPEKILSLACNLSPPFSFLFLSLSTSVYSVELTLNNSMTRYISNFYNLD